MSADEAAEATSRPPSVVVAASGEARMRRLLEVAEPAAAARRARLVLVSLRDPATLSGPGAEPGWLRPLVDSLREHGVQAVAAGRFGTDLAAEVRGVARQESAELLILDWRDDALPEDATAEGRAARRAVDAATRALFSDPPCTTWLLRGRIGGRSVGDVLLVPERQVPSTHLLDAARALTPPRARVFVLDAHANGRTREWPVEARARLDATFPSHEVVAVHAATRDRAVLEAAQEHAYDLVFLDAAPSGFPARLGVPAVPVRIAERHEGPLIAVSVPQPALVSWLRRRWDRVYGYVGTLDEEEQLQIYGDLRRAARGNRDFFVLTVLAAAIAALGLLLNSAAVIIGAMLVAPFMSPVVALGLGVVYGEGRFLRVALGAILRGTAVSLAVAAIIGLAGPQIDLTSEIIARTQPSGLDLVVALVSGAAGAYAYGRRELSAALPGVAIAAALVPPVSSAGLAFALGDFGEAAGAALLYVTNVGAIAAAAAVVFLWFGFKPDVSRFGRLRSFSRGVGALVVLLVLVSAAIVALRAQEQRAHRFERAVEEIATASLLPGEVLRESSAELRGGVVYANVELGASLDSASASARAEALQAQLAERLGRQVEVNLAVVPLSRAGP